MSECSVQRAQKRFCKSSSPPNVISSRNDVTGIVGSGVKNGANVSV